MTFEIKNAECDACGRDRMTIQGPYYAVDRLCRQCIKMLLYALTQAESGEGYDDKESEADTNDH